MDNHDVVRDRQARIIAGPDATGSEAIDLLGRFSFVGRSDRFDESLVLMQQAVGIPDIRYASKWVAPSNEIKKGLLSDPVTRAQLGSVNRHDLAVWEHAVAEVFPKRLAEYGPGLDDAVAAFRERNSHMARRRQYARPRVRRVCRQMASRLSAMGAQSHRRSHCWLRRHYLHAGPVAQLGRATGFLTRRLRVRFPPGPQETVIGISLQSSARRVAGFVSPHVFAFWLLPDA